MADGTFPESVGFIVFVHPVEKPKEVFGERMWCLEGDWANKPSRLTQPIVMHKINALRLASICAPQGTKITSAKTKKVHEEKPPVYYFFLKCYFSAASQMNSGCTHGSCFRYLSLWAWSLLQWHQLELGLGLSRELHPGRVWDPPPGVHAPDGALQEPHLQREGGTCPLTF